MIVMIQKSKVAILITWNEIVDIIWLWYVLKEGFLHRDKNGPFSINSKNNWFKTYFEIWSGAKFKRRRWEKVCTGDKKLRNTPKENISVIKKIVFVW